MIYYIVYVSTAKIKFTSNQLRELLTKSRNYNQKNEITGMLLYSDGDFVQVLEGDKETVQALFERISKDKRHRQVIKIKAGYWESRKFSTWSMGFYEVSMEDRHNLPGFKDLKKRQIFNEIDEQDSHPAVISLMSFYDNLPVYKRLAMM